MEEIGAPNGTTIIVRNLFYNTLPRKKFLKQPQTEGSYVADLMEHLALSHPQISFSFIINNQNRFYTSGNSDLKEIIYRIYGKDIVKELQEIHAEADGFSIDGFLGRPIINRSNRNYELFYINGRFIKSNLIGKAVEDGYKEYLMQHKFPFCVLHFTIDTKRIDVNVHPTKMEVRIAGGQEFYEQVRELIHERLHRQEMIPEVSFEQPEKTRKEAVIGDNDARETKSRESESQKRESKEIAFPKSCDREIPGKRDAVSAISKSKPPRPPVVPEPFETRRLAQENVVLQQSLLREPTAYAADTSIPDSASDAGTKQLDTASQKPAAKPEQLELFDDKLLSAKAKEHYEIIGQLFDTYWLISYQDKLLIIDQHAAHEKVKYERFIKRFKEHSIVSQNLNPPVVVTLSGREKACLLQNKAHFEALGFVLEEFGGNDYALSSVPLDLYGYQEAGLFYELLDEMVGENFSGTPDSIRTKIATMACKAAVKGNSRMSAAEADALIDELLSLENPYNCPHGRPTMITMSKYELEKKFKRIVT